MFPHKPFRYCENENDTSSNTPGWQTSDKMPSLISNPALQFAAAFVIFFGGFIVLFAFLLLCAAVGWVLCLCAKRLAVLIAASRQEQPVAPAIARRLLTPTGVTSRLRQQSARS